jgi:hypothetical protein
MVSIYALRCKLNGFAYVGCTKWKTAKRMREHRCLLNAGRHSADLLQADWIRYGAEAFEIVVIQGLPDDATVQQKRRAELAWIGRFKEAGKLYNAHVVSFELSPEARAKGVACAHDKPGNRWTPEANEKRRQSQLGIPKGHGAKISATKRANRERQG